MVIKVGEKWCQATKTWKFWWNFLAKSLFFSCYPSFSPFERPDAYKCYTFSESYGSRETRGIKSSSSKFDIEAGGILSSLWTQTGPWSDTASYFKHYYSNNTNYICYEINASKRNTNYYTGLFFWLVRLKKWLSVSLHTKSHSKSSICRNILRVWHFCRAEQ